MAVINGFPGIKVEVKVAGEVATEYDDPDAAEERLDLYDPTCKTSSKYIKSIDNADFQISLKVDNSCHWLDVCHSITLIIRVDGKDVASEVFSSPVDGAHGTRLVRGIYANIGSRWTIRKLHFATVSTVDDTARERIKKEMLITKNLGLIDIEVKRCIMKGRKSPPSRQDLDGSTLELAEKSIKGKTISHGTKTVDGGYTTLPVFFDIEYLDKSPIARFRFKYRSKDALQSMFIIPRSPSPKPTIVGLSQAEINRLAQERLDQIRDETRVKMEDQPTMKREFRETNGHTQDGAPPRPLKVSRLDSGEELIDLTDD